MNDFGIFHVKERGKMLMNHKRGLIFLSLLFILAAGLGAVSAHGDLDFQSDLTGLDESPDQTPIENNDIEDKCQSDVENEVLANENSPDEKLSATISINGGTFDDIQNAVDGANPGDTLELSGTFQSTGKMINIPKNMTIKGNPNAVLDAKKSSGIIHFTGENLYISGLTFKNSNCVDGAVHTGKYLEDVYGEDYDYSNFNHAQNLKFSVVNCIFQDNAGDFCAALNLYSYSLKMTGTNFMNNKAKNAGAVNMHGGNAELSNCNFADNSANFNPDISYFSEFDDKAVGAVSITGDSVSIANCKFTNNNAKTNYNGYCAAGALYVTANCVMDNCYFEKNSVKGKSETLDGGAFFHNGYDTTCVVKNSKFVSNQASSTEARGSAITSHSDKPISILNCDFRNNDLKSHDHDGGAVYADKGYIKGCNFENNHADWGGAVGGDYLTVENCVFKNNHADKYGGAIVFYDGTVKSCTFEKNTAERYGGAVYSQHAVSVSKSTFKNNVAEGYGSAIGVWDPDGAKLVVTDSKFSNNVAKAKGTTYNYPYKNYGNGAIFHLGYFNHLKCSIKNCKGLSKNTNKFKDTTKISASKLVYKGGHFTATLKDSKGNPIKGIKLTIKINGKKYKKTTDKKGRASVLVKLAASKSYKVKVSFKGNNFYIKSSKSVKLTVKKANPKIIASKKAFKSNVKTKKYVVGLKDGKKAMKKTKLTLKVNGKIYGAKTNSKGKATFKIAKLTKKGTYKAVVRLADTKYKKTSKSVKIVVK